MQKHELTRINLSFTLIPLMLTLVILPLVDGGFDHPAIFWTLFMLIAASIFLYFRNRISFTMDITNSLTWYCLFFLWAGISIIWSLNPHRTLVEFLQLSCYGLVFLLASQLNEDNLFRLGRIAWIAGIGAALFGICQYLFLTTGRIAGTFTNPNPFGIYLTMIFFLGWGYCLRRPDRWVYAGSIVLLIALFLSGSRGSFIAFALALPFLAWGSSRPELGKRIIKTALVIGISLMLTQGIMVLAPSIQSALVFQEALESQPGVTAFLTRPESFIASSGVGRFAFWDVAGRLFLNEPLKGYGLGTFYVAYHQGYPGDIWYSRFAHNHYLQVLAELGVVGFGLLGAFLITLLRRAWLILRSQNYPDFFPGIIAVIAAFLIHIGVDFSWNFPGAAVVFFAAAGGVAGISGVHVKPTKGIRMPRLAVTTSLILLFLLAAWQYSAQLLYEHGVKLELAGDTEGATAAYNRTIALYPIYSIYYFNTGRHYYNLSLYEDEPLYLDKSVEMLQQAVRYSPADAAIHQRLGKLYKEAGNIEAAEKHFLLAMKYAGYRIGMYLDLGWLYLGQERFEEAEQVLLETLELEEVVLKRSHGEPHLKEQLYYLYLILKEVYKETNRDELATYYNDKAWRMLEEREAIIYNES